MCEYLINGGVVIKLHLSRDNGSIKQKKFRIELMLHEKHEGDKHFKK